MKQAAMKAMENVDFHFYREPVRSDVLTDRQYKSYMDRARDLGIKVVPKSNSMIDDVINRMSSKV